MPIFKLFASEDEALLVWGNAVWHVSGQTLTLQRLRKKFEVFVITNHICNHNTSKKFEVPAMYMNGLRQRRRRQVPVSTLCCADPTNPLTLSTVDAHDIHPHPQRR